MDGTAGKGHDAVAAFGVKADDVFPLFVHAHGQLQFVAVAVGQIAFHGGGDGDVDARDLPQGVLYDVALEAELTAIGEMLQLAPPAAGEDGAFGAHALFGGREDLLRLAVADFVLYFQDAERNLFSGQTIRHEKSNSFVPDNSFAVTAQSLRHGTDNLIFFNHFGFSFLLLVCISRPPAHFFLPKKRFTRASVAFWQRVNK